MEATGAICSAMDEMIKNGKIREMIVVAPRMERLYSSFIQTDGTGVRDCITELPRMINYAPTLAESGIAGHSMDDTARLHS
jgi:hypothetical protein